MEPIISKCGYRCDLCPAHESNLKTEADKKIMCDAWNKYLGGSIEPEAISACGGCQAEGNQGDESCPVRPCAIGKGVETCAHCEEFACEKVKSKMNFVEESERAGIWTLQGMILRENLTSLALCKKCGFREVGYRERISQMNGVWRDVILMERRSKVVGINKEFKEAEL